MKKSLNLIMSMAAVLSLSACDAFVVSSQAIKPGEIPEKPFAESDTNWDPAIVVAINHKNEIWIDEKTYALGEISEVLKALKAETPEATGILIVDEDASAAMVYEVQTVLQDLGIPTRVSTK